MSILIKGMEMPKRGFVDVRIFADDGVCTTTDGETPYYKEYHAVPVPPHGRLGDLNVQDAQIEALIERHLHGYTRSTWDFVCQLRDILKRNRTIIPAEEGE